MAENDTITLDRGQVREIGQVLFDNLNERLFALKSDFKNNSQTRERITGVRNDIYSIIEAMHHLSEFLKKDTHYFLRVQLLFGGIENASLNTAMEGIEMLENTFIEMEAQYILFKGNR